MFAVFMGLVGDAIFFFAAHRVDSRFVTGLVGTYEVRTLLDRCRCNVVMERRGYSYSVTQSRPVITED